MIDSTTAYARLVVSGKRPAGRSEVLCCKRHLDDMKRKRFGYVFDVEEAERNIKISNTLTIGEGEKERPLVTRGFQNFIIGSIFGWRKKRSRERRYREAYIQMGRQNGKSFLSGILCVIFSTFDGYKLGRIFCTATKQDQANLVWDESDKFIESDKRLKKLFQIRKYDHTITSLVTGCTIKAIGKDTKTADGFRSIYANVDEYHAHDTDQMYKLMLDGQITVDGALTTAITTAGFNLNGPCYGQYQFCKRILSGNIRKDSLFIYIAEMDPDDDIWKPENWAKANPLNLWKSDAELDEEMLARMAEKAIDAKNKGGSDLLNFQTKSLNTWVTATDDSYIDLLAWHACATDTTLDDMAGRECYLGLDLSSGGDLTSIALVFSLGDEGAYVHSHSFMPKLRMAEHERTDDAPYRQWVRDGLITLTEGICGIKTDYKYIIAYLSEIIAKNKLKIIGCGYDNHNAAAFLDDLGDACGCDLTEIVQSAKSLNDATRDFALSVKAKHVKYDRKNDVMTWSFVNAVTVQNSFKEIKIDKNAQKKRIDPCDAVIDAWKLYFGNKDGTLNDANDAIDDWGALLADSSGEGAD